jgi:hypothetical protein
VARVEAHGLRGEDRAGSGGVAEMADTAKTLCVRLAHEVVSNLDEGQLQCPHCDGTYLHQTKVEVFWRGERAVDGRMIGREDAPSIAVVIDDGTASLGIPTRNPSTRRDGLLIHFFCENCDYRPTLAIAQHKGQTMIFWDQRFGICRDADVD